MIGYEPDGETFAPQGKTPRLHKITVSVRRPGIRATTRKEFIGVSDAPRSSAPLTPAQELVRAAISPFGMNSLAVHATHYEGYSRSYGMFVRTVLHLDAQALTYARDASGRKTASADLVGLVYDSGGTQVDTITTGFDVTLETAAAERAITDGLVYTARVPIAKPGGYQLRYAVRDRRSGAVGSAGGFVNIPDVKNGAFALSGLVLRSGDSSVPNEPLDSDRFSVRPADTVRVYPAGTRLSYSYEIYNARTSVRAAASLWRGSERLVTLPLETLTPPASGEHFVANGGFALDNQQASGTYVIEVIVTPGDASRAGEPRRAVQRLSFDVK